MFVRCYRAIYIVCKILMFTCISVDNCSSGCITLIPVIVVLCHVTHELNVYDSQLSIKLLLLVKWIYIG